MAIIIRIQNTVRPTPPRGISDQPISHRPIKPPSIPLSSTDLPKAVTLPILKAPVSHHPLGASLGIIQLSRMSLLPSYPSRIKSKDQRKDWDHRQKSPVWRMPHPAQPHIKSRQIEDPIKQKAHPHPEKNFQMTRHRIKDRIENGIINKNAKTKKAIPHKAKPRHFLPPRPSKNKSKIPVFPLYTKITYINR